MKPQIPPKEPRRLSENGTSRRELAECRSLLVSGVQLQDGLGPQLTFGEPFTHKRVDPRIENMHKALDIVPVLLDDVLTQMENVKGHRRVGSQRPFQETAG
jgi:hypothetical protein